MPGERRVRRIYGANSVDLRAAGISKRRDTTRPANSDADVKIAHKQAANRLERKAAITPRALRLRAAYGSD